MIEQLYTCSHSKTLTLSLSKAVQKYRTSHKEQKVTYKKTCIHIITFTMVIEEENKNKVNILFIGKVNRLTLVTLQGCGPKGIAD